MSNIICNSCTGSNQSKIDYSSSLSMIYTLITFNSVIYFISLSSSNGSLANQYLCSLLTCTTISGTYVNDKFVYLLFYCANNYISVYSTASSTFANYYFTNPATSVNVFASDGYKIYFGGSLTNGYTISSVLNALTTNSDISTTSFSMNVYSSGQSNSVVTGSVTSLAYSTYSITSVAGTPTFDTSSSVSDTTTKTDVQYYVNPVTYSGLSSYTSYTKSVSLTCSTAGSTSITYSLVSYNGQNLPSWVTLDSTNQQLSFKTPCSTSSTTYQFAIEASVSGSSIQTPINLVVSPPNNGSCAVYYPTISSSSATAITTTSVSVVSATTVSTSLLSGGSPNSLWVMINQLQFFMLYPMIGAFVPDTIIDFLKGVSFTLFNFNFIKFPSTEISDGFSSFFACNPTDSYMSSINLGSVCTIVNQINLVIMFIVIMIIHFPVVLVFRGSKHTRGCRKKILGYAFMLFTFSIYLRTIFEASLGILLSSLNELYVHDLSSFGKTISFVITICAVLSIILFWTFTYYIAKLASHPEYDPEATYLNEVVEGTKENLAARLLFFTMIAKIMLSVACVIFTQNLSSIVRISIYVTIQTVFLIILLIVRNYKKTSDNIIHILNDLVYYIACVALFRYNTTTNWSDGFITAFFATITVNGLTISLIQFIVLFRELYFIYVKCRQIRASKLKDEEEAQRKYFNNPVNSTFQVNKVTHMKEEVKSSISGQFRPPKRNMDRETSENSIFAGSL